MADKIRTAVALYDLHFPKWHKPTVDALFDFLKQNTPDVFILGGDQFDNAAISHHNNNKPLYKEAGSYIRDEEDFEAKFLTPLEDLLPENCEKIWIIGNHDFWEFEYIEANPELQGLVDRTRSLKLIKRGWKIIPIGHSYKLGKLSFIHGELLTGIGNQGGAYPAKKAVDLYAGNVVGGHVHTCQTFVKVSPADQKHKWIGVIAPCACEVNAHYLRNRPTAWVNGLNITEVAADGNFNNYNCVVTNGKFLYGGKLYGGKKRD